MHILSVFSVFRIILLMDREERAATGALAGNASPHNSALRLATAYSKGICMFPLLREAFGELLLVELLF